MEVEANESPGFVIATWSDHKKDKWYKLQADVTVEDGAIVGDVTLTVRGLSGTDVYSCPVDEFRILERSIRIGRDKVSLPQQVIADLHNYFSPFDLEDRALETIKPGRF